MAFSNREAQNSPDLPLGKHGEAYAPLPARQDRSVTTSQDAPVRDGHMPAPAAWLAWGLCAVSLTLVILGLVYGAWAHSLLWAFAEWAANAIVAVSFRGVGALIATH
jgi:hypothetical protein